MPTIPVGRFGNAVASPGQVVVPEAIDTGAGTRRIAQAGEAIASDLVKREQRTLEINNRAQAMTALGAGKDALAALAFEVQDGVRSGQLPKGEAETSYRTRADQVVAQLPELSPDLSPIVRAELTSSAATLGLNVRESVINRARSETSAAMLSQVEALGRQYVADPQGADANFATMLEEWGPESDFTPEQLTALRTKYGESTRYTAALATFHDAGDDIGKLRAALGRISDPANFKEMDPTMRENLAARVEGRIDTLHQRALAAADRREAAADRAYARAMQLTMTGFGFDEAAAQALVNDTAGTSVAGDAQALVRQNRAIQRVLAGPVEEQVATVQAMRAQLAQSGAQDVSQVVALQRLETAVANNVKQIRENPLLAMAQRVGGQLDPLNVRDFVAGRGTGEPRDVLRDRLVQLRAAGKRFGPVAGKQPLLPQEVAELQAVVASARTADELAAVYGALRVALVETPADNVFYQAALKQLAGGQGAVNPVVLQAGDLFATNPRAGARVMRGQRADPKLFAPNQNEFATAFADYVGDAFRGREDALGVAMATARSYYMGAIAEGGQPMSQAEGSLDASKVEEAIRQSVGIPVEHGDHVVMAPPGMDESTFLDRIDAAWREAVGAGKLPESELDNLDEYSLQNGPDGHTFAVVRGRRYAPVLLNIDPSRTINVPPPKPAPWAGLPMGVPE